MSNRERIVTGQKYRILADFTNKIWDRISFWTKASDVEFDDGSNAQQFAGNVNTSLSVIDNTLSQHGSAINNTNSRLDALSTTVGGDGTAISNLQSSVSGLQSSVSTMSGQISGINSTLSNHESRISTNTNNITNINNRLNGYTLVKTNALPSNPSASTIYFIPK